MKKFLLLFFLFPVIFSSAAAEVRAEDWKDIKLSTTDGSFSINDLKGKTVLLMFWATWCPHCKNQIPALSLLKNSYSSINNLEILAVSTDEDGVPAVQNFYQTQNITNLPVIIDNDSNLFKNMGFSGIPTVVLISKESKILGIYRGLQNFDIQYLDKVLGKNV